MKFLLDTHTFLWFIAGDPTLPKYARHHIEDMVNDRLLSIASLWEMSIKVSIGKLTVSLPFPELVEQHVYQNAMQLLQITPEHVEVLRTLALYHKDPFDRLLISQGVSEHLTIISRDEVFDAYGVQRLWRK